MYPLSVQKGKTHERAGIFTATIAVRAQIRLQSSGYTEILY